jgi:pantothenate synthetase
LSGKSPTNQRTLYLKNGLAKSSREDTIREKIQIKAHSLPNVLQEIDHL